MVGLRIIIYLILLVIAHIESERCKVEIVNERGNISSLSAKAI